MLSIKHLSYATLPVAGLALSSIAAGHAQINAVFYSNAPDGAVVWGCGSGQEMIDAEAQAFDVNGNPQNCGAASGQDGTTVQNCERAV